MRTSFFGVQVALDIPPDDPLRSRLKTLVSDAREGTTLASQRPCWSRIAAALIPTVPTIGFATWDLIRDTGQAEYEEWASGLEAMAEWPLADFGSGGQFLLVTILFQVAADSNADRTLGDLCDIPERAWQMPRTYRRLLAAPPQLNFTNVLGSGFYVAPRPDHPGFSREVLTGEGFEYLEPLSD